MSLIIVLSAAALGAGSKARAADVRVLDIISAHDDPNEAGRKKQNPPPHTVSHKEVPHSLASHSEHANPLNKTSQPIEK